MSRILRWGVFAFALAAGSVCQAATVRMDERPNVVVILADDQGWGDLSVHGNANLRTPNIDSLARDGALFDRFFVCPLCAPTRAEFLTGRYHSRGGVRGVTTGAERLNVDEKTIGDAFRAAGYATAAFGKWHNGSQYPYHPNARGFQEYYGFTSGHWGQYFDPVLEHNGQLVRGKGFIIDDLTDRALAFLEENRDRPLFCYLPYNTPHSPFQVPDRFYERFKDAPIAMRARDPKSEELEKTRCVLAMCENIDWNVGRVLRKLDELGLAEKTIVVYFSDNGPNTSRYNGGMKGRKGSTDEGGVRVPCLVRWPGHVKPGTRIPQIAAAIDFLPTLASMAGIPVAGAKPLDGLNLKPLLTGAAGQWPDRMIFSHQAGKVSVRTQQYRLDAKGALFDMTADPGQDRDLSRQRPQQAAELREAVAAWKKEVLPASENDDRPFPVGHRAFPAAPLPARDGVGWGNIRRSAAAPNCSYFTNWRSTEDKITWDIEVAAGGDYEAIVHYTCPKADLGSTVELSFNGSRIQGKVDQAFDPPLVDTMDRVPRQGESDVKDFRPLRLGAFRLEKGRGPLTLRALEVPGRQVMDVRAVVLTVGPAGAAAMPSPPSRPNVLWITCEDTSPSLGCYGDAYAITPSLDALARQGVRYTRAFATASVCSPARSCLVTGLYATSLGTQNLRSSFPVPPAFKGFPFYLRQAGYFTTNNVKTDYNLAGEPAFIREAWDRCGPAAHWRERRPGQPFFSVFNIMDTHQSRSNVWSFAEFEKEIGAKLSPAERHDPAGAPLPPFYPDTPLARRTLARCYDCTTAMDKEAGRLLKQLDDDGLAGETIVFFYGDGGVGMPRGKRTLYDTGLRVPLVLRFPEKFAHRAPAGPGKTSDRLVSFVDFAPTVLSLAGLPVPSHVQGRAFLGSAAGAPREYVFGARDRVDEVFDLSRSVRDARWLYVRNYMPHLSWMQPEGFSDQAELRREMARLAAEGRLDAAQRTYAAPTRPLEELYDGDADPFQVHNLAASSEHRAVLERMRRRLGDWMVEIRDVGFLTEHDLAARTVGKPAFDWARREGSYPQDRILGAAELVGRAESLEKQAALLGDADCGVRYWAAVGLRAQGERAAAARAAIAKALDDSSASVRIEAAAILASLGDSGRPLAVLVASLRGGDPNAALHAARAVELLGEKARPVAAAIREALDAVKKSPRAGDPELFVQFALQAAVENLDKPK